MNIQHIKTAVEMLQRNVPQPLIYNTLNQQGLWDAGVIAEVYGAADCIVRNKEWLHNAYQSGQTDAQIHASLTQAGFSTTILAGITDAFKEMNGTDNGTKPQVAVGAVGTAGADAAADAATPIAVPNVERTELREANVDPLPFVPQAMKDLPQWVLWKLEEVDGRMTKVPYQTSGKKASSTNPSHWTDYQTAINAVNGVVNENGGVGFMFANNVMGVDLDGAHDKSTGEIKQWAADIIDAFGDDVYVEVSPSGTGLHIFFFGKKTIPDSKFNLNPAIGYGKAAIEIYDTARFFTVTGQAYFENTGGLRECDLAPVCELFYKLKAEHPVPKSEKSEKAGVADTLTSGEGVQPVWAGTFRCSKYDIFMQGEGDPLAKPFTISNGIGSLTYPSHSEADMAFATVLAIFHDGDAEKMSHDFRNSQSMYREKWDRLEVKTIAKAIASAEKYKATRGNSGATTIQPPPNPTAVPPSAETPPMVFPFAPTPVPIAEDGKEKIPPFDPTVMTGFFKDFVDTVCAHTTIPRQFAYLAIRVFAGAYMSRLSDNEKPTPVLRS